MTARARRPGAAPRSPVLRSGARPVARPTARPGFWLAAWAGAWFALGSGCGGPAPPAGPAPIVPSNPATRTFFWRIECPRGCEGGPSYLLGTMHVGVDPREVLPAGIWQKFDASARFVMEVDTTGPETLGLGMQPEGTSLVDELPAGGWERLLAALGLTAEQAEPLARVKPWMLMAQLTQELAAKIHPDAQGDVSSIEDVLHTRAAEARTPVVFLETAGVQAALLERFVDGEYLLEFVEDLPRQQRSLERQAEIYRQGDDQALFEVAIVNMTKHIGADGMEALVYRRNEAWIPRLVAEVEAGGAFIAVGAAHLLGDRGVVALLRARGLTVTRIRE